MLDAAAALFCTDGFTSTSTRANADAAGVRQASIYHHFAGKDAILLELLLGTVRPSLELADALAAGTEPAAARLWALVHAEVVAGGGYTHLAVARGTHVRLTDIQGDACAHVLAYRLDRPWERLNVADTV